MTKPTNTVATDGATIESLIVAARTENGIDTMNVDGLQMLANHFKITDHVGKLVDFLSPGTSDYVWQQAVGEIRNAVNSLER